jgi:sugar transferase (PEP-CTERM/EpsH1 system associated)
MSQPLHVVHLLYRFAAGGLENVLVQLINGLPHGEFRHSLLALTEVDPAFVARIQREDVQIIALHKSPGQPFKLYPRVYRLLRELKPDVVHSCNIAALEFMPVATAAGVPLRVHAEHGWDVADPDGSNRKYQALRRLYRRFVHSFIAVSPQLQDYLRDKVRISASRLHFIPNGVDTDRYRPPSAADTGPVDFPFRRNEHIVVGTVGRLEPIKNQALLIAAFIELAQSEHPLADHLRLVVVGDGPEREGLSNSLKAVNLAERAWLPGSRADVPEILQELDLFVLPSLAEGTSCTLQEAMATSLPIIATDVGGNADLLEQGRFGALVGSNNVAALVAAIRIWLDKQYGNSDAGGLAKREWVQSHYSRQRMLNDYAAIFSSRKSRHGGGV